MKWDDNLLLEGDPEDMALRGQYQLAMYALHLNTGHTIYCKQIKGATIEQYIYAAATFLAFFTGRDFRKDDPTHKTMGYILAPVYRDIKKYELLPDRKEPYSPKMHSLAKEIAARFSPDCLVAALTNSFEQGYCAGYRLGEFAQPANRSDPTSPQLSNDPTAIIRTRAFVPNDFRAQLHTGARLRGLEIILHRLEEIDLIFPCWRTQKNGRHGEEKKYARNPNPLGVCFVSAVYRALKCFRRLMMLDPRLDPSFTPLTVYWSTKENCVKLLNAIHIETFMRRLAMTVYHLHPVRDAKELQRWSSRSLRVGAAVTLHAMGFSGLDIQWMLRWQSTAFMVYLRNVAVLSQRQCEALDRAAALPFL